MADNIRLMVSRTVVLDSDGAGSISIGPERYGESWSVTRYTTGGNSAVEPDLRVYRNVVGSNLLDTTSRGNGDVSETDVELLAGENVTFVYSLGSPGALMSIYVEGDINYGV